MEPRPSRPEAAKQNLADIAAKARAEALVGAVLSGRYHLIELLAMGGVGAVYLAEHVRMHKHVAVKVLHPDSQDLPDLVARFEREAVAGAHVQHPNVAAATDFGELDDGSFFLVLEYVRGSTLRDVIRRGPLPSGRAVRIAKQIASALAATHAMGIVHRDIKPRNVMLIEGERDVVKVIDFGLAKVDLKQVSLVAANRASDPDSRLTSSGAVFGTIAYLPPEASIGMDAVDSRADLYALGLVLYEMLSGKHPFDTTDPVEILRRHARDKPPPFMERAPEVVVPPSLEAVVMRLLEKSPDARYESADALIAALDAALDLGSATPLPVQLADDAPVFPGPSILPPPPAVEAPAIVSEPPRPSMPHWIYAGGAGLVALAAGVTWWVSTPRPVATVAPPPPPVASSIASAVSVPTAPSSSVEPPPLAPSASASASSTARAAPFDATASRSMLRIAANAHDWPRATDAFFALAEHDPSEFRDPVLVLAARDVAAAAGKGGGDLADRLFDTLAHRMGAEGPDILYEIMRSRGGSRASVLAEELFRRPEVLALASPATRITVELRRAACPDKLTLLDRAAEEGDARTLAVMETIGTTCLGRDPALAAAIKALRKRLRMP